MEKLLRTLFDYQRFCPNRDLAVLIQQTESRYSSALSDEDISLINAAGNPNSNMPWDKKL